MAKSSVAQDTLLNIEPVRTYATRENTIKAVERRVSKAMAEQFNLRWFIMVHTDGRFFPVFLGERALQAGLHFHFNVVG